MEKTDGYLYPPRLHRAVLPSATIRTQPEDFVVQEVPAYQPCGTGEHLFLWLEKKDVSSAGLVTQLARMLDIKSRDIGVAGQKDRRAVTRQFVSVPGRCLNRIVSSVSGNVRILSVTAHKNKLRTGHVSGNSFQIVLRPSETDAFTKQQAEAVRERLELLAAQGFPNYYGPQRFGNNGQSVDDGRVLLQQSQPNGEVKRVKRHLRKLLASAVQSAVFNQVLAGRVADGTFNMPQSGDVVCRKDGIRPFLFDDRGDTSADVLVPMGPMPGPKMQLATGCVLEYEQRVFDELNLSWNAFNRNAKLTPGTRRKMVEYPSSVSVSLQNDGSIQTEFILVAGAYATVLLSEVCDIISHHNHF